MGHMINQLKDLFSPESIAIIGVSATSNVFGGSSFLKRLQEVEFPGRLYPVNPKAVEIQGLRAYPDLTSLPETPDLAIVCISARFVPDLLLECVKTGLKNIHILSSGFKEMGTPEGIELEERIAEIARQNGLSIVGPNCMGLYCPASKLTAWGGIPGVSGTVGIISQSGGITQRLTEYLSSLAVGVSKAVSVGNATVLDVVDYLELFGDDPSIDVIAIYLEDIHNGRKLLERVQAINSVKPIIILKGGSSDAGARTIASHTGAMGGNEQIWNAFFRQTGVVRVQAVDEWADAIIALNLLPPPDGDGVFLAGGGGGVMTISSDICHIEGLTVPQLSEQTMLALQEVIPGTGSIAGNPLDSFEIFYNPSHLCQVANIITKDPSVSMFVVDRLISRKAFHLPDLPDQTDEIIERLQSVNKSLPTIITVDTDGGDALLGQEGIDMRRRFHHASIPAYPSSARAIRALRHYSHYHKKRIID